MEVDWDADLFFERFHKNFGGGGLEQACHVFQTEDMCPRGFELFGHVDVIFQVIFGAGGVENIACVADRAFAELSAVLHGVHGHAHVFDPVEAVKDAEDINA